MFLRVREKKEGDEAMVAVRRDGVEKSLRVKFFPIPGKKPHRRERSRRLLRRRGDLPGGLRKPAAGEAA